MAKQICPICDIPLRPRLIQGTHLFCCEECLGFAFRLGDVERLSDLALARSLWRAAVHAPHSERIKCPNCRLPSRDVFDRSRDFQDGDVVVRRELRLHVCCLCHLGWMRFYAYALTPIERFDAPVTDVAKFYTHYAETLLAMLKERDHFINAFQVEEFNLYWDDHDNWRLALAFFTLAVAEEHEELDATPVLTQSLIATCSLVSVLAFWNMPWALHHLSMRTSDSFFRQSFNSVTSFFVHGNWLHLISNLLAFWVFGPSVESFLGRTRYLLLIFMSAWLGGMLVMMVDEGSQRTMLIGASGGIFGLILFYCVRFWHRRLIVQFWDWRLIPRILFIPAWIFAFPLIFVQWISFLGVYAMTGRGGSFLAHLGGAAVGIGFGLYYRWPHYMRDPRLGPDIRGSAREVRKLAGTTTRKLIDSLRRPE